MATPYAEYYNKALANYKPQQDASMAASNATMADRGLYNSTAAVGKLGQIRNEYDAAARQAATQQQQYDVAAANQERQTALQWFDAVNNLALAKKQIGGYKGNQIQYQARPSWLDSYFATNPAQIGDGKGKVVQPTTEKLGKYNFQDSGGKTNAEVNAANAQKNAEASLALQRQRLAMEIAAYKDSKKQQNDPWGQMAQAAFQGIGMDSDPSTPGHQSAVLPSTLLSTFAGQYGIDVVGEAASGNPKALGIVKTLYPQTWAKIVSGEYKPGQPSVLGGAVAAATQGSGGSSSGVSNSGSRWDEFVNMRPNSRLINWSPNGNGLINLNKLGPWLFDPNSNR